MGLFGDPEGIFTSIHTAAAPGEATAYRAHPQFAVALPKLAVMSLCTFGLYEIYWAYKHWVAIRQRENEELMPFWRAFFAPLWGFSLLPRLQHLAASHGVPATWSGSGLALAYFILHATWRLPDPLWLVSLLGFLPLLAVQRAMNRLNATEAPDAPRNDAYSLLNVAMILVGGMFLVLVIWSTFMPALEQTARPTIVT